MSISSKSINRINKAVETQTQPAKAKPLPIPKASSADTTLQKDTAASGITQKLPDYLL